MQWVRDDFRITDDPTEIALPVVHHLLAGTYWAKTRPVERTEMAIQHSISFSLFHKTRQIGFGRAFTDYGVYAIVSDVVIAPDYRGLGLGKWLITTMIAHPDVKDLRLVLWTTDQVEFYRACGLNYEEHFKLLGKPPNFCLPNQKEPDCLRHEV